jgi:hypothetical protein
MPAIIESIFLSLQGTEDWYETESTHFEERAGFAIYFYMDSPPVF